VLGDAGEAAPGGSCRPEVEPRGLPIAAEAGAQNREKGGGAALLLDYRLGVEGKCAN
jgi:hypothetical protein